MQVSVEKTSELSRKMTVQVPESRVQQQVNERLQSLAGKVKIDGFRPGKVPSHIIKKRYGASVRDEVVADLIQSTFYEAIRTENLNPAGGPTIDPEPFVDGKDLSYIAHFEVMPEFEPSPLNVLEVKRYTSEVADSDLHDMIEKLREQRKTWETVTRPAVQGDRITITFAGSINGENFTNGTVENVPVVIGSGTLIPGFEEKLVGADTGAHIEFDISFPADYQAEKLAGKTATFVVDVGTIEEGRLPDVDAAFAESFGVADGDIEGFRSDIRENMQREMARALRARTKRDVLDALYERNSDVPTPKVLVDQELEQLLRPYRDSAKQNKRALDEADLKLRLEPMAKKRVTLGMLMNKILQSEQVKLDQKRVRETVEDMAQSYENPEQVVQWYYNNPSQLRNIEGLVLEEQMVDAVLAKASVSEVNLPFKELMQQNDSAAAAG